MTNSQEYNVNTRLVFTVEQKIKILCQKFHATLWALTYSLVYHSNWNYTFKIFLTSKQIINQQLKVRRSCSIPIPYASVICVYFIFKMTISAHIIKQNTLVKFIITRRSFAQSNTDIQTFCLHMYKLIFSEFTGKSVQ